MLYALPSAMLFWVQEDAAMQAYMYPMLKDDFQVVETYQVSKVQPVGYTWSHTELPHCCERGTGCTAHASAARGRVNCQSSLLYIGSAGGCPLQQTSPRTAGHAGRSVQRMAQEHHERGRLSGDYMHSSTLTGCCCKLRVLPAAKQPRQQNSRAHCCHWRGTRQEIHATTGAAHTNMTSLTSALLVHCLEHPTPHIPQTASRIAC
jgi:hypothetical protein